MGVYCPNCKTNREVTFDQIAANTCCEVCGMVIEEGAMVSEVAFSEDSHVIGQFVGESEGTRNFRGMPGGSSDSREQTLNKAKRNLQNIGSKLNITEDLIDAAHRFYKLALENQFTRGRKSNHVAVACLYTVCRIEKKPIMLLDFSEQLQEDVFVLGRCFTELVRNLQLKDVPICEPYIYIRRFASKLEFGNKMNAVVQTALKLVSRMRRDWMETGRRPAGLCASAIVISARIHGFRRSQEEVANTVRICTATLSKRLQEFSQTECAKLTPEEFESFGETIQIEMNPPCFDKSFKRKKKKKKKKKEEEEDEEEEEKETKKEEKKEQELEDISSKVDVNNDENLIKDLEKTMESEQFKTLEKDLEYSQTQKEKFNFEVEETEIKKKKEDNEVNGNLDELDDNELEEYIIKDEEEIGIREKLFDGEYLEFLVEKEKKDEEKKLKEEEKEKNGGSKPRKKRQKKEGPEPPAKSAAEATSNMLKKKKIKHVTEMDFETMFQEEKIIPKINRPPEKPKQDPFEELMSQYKF